MKPMSLLYPRDGFHTLSQSQGTGGRYMTHHVSVSVFRWNEPELPVCFLHTLSELRTPHILQGHAISLSYAPVPVGF